MEYICGKQTASLELADFQACLEKYQKVLVDIGTGDGRFVQNYAQNCPEALAIGVDACRENSQQVSRKARPNTLFLIANALWLPPELTGVADLVTINFPWGSLLQGLLKGESGLSENLLKLLRPSAKIEIRLNQSAVEKAGYSLAEAGLKVQHNLRLGGFSVTNPLWLEREVLKEVPTTWAKRLAYGREAEAVYLRATPLNIYAGESRIPDFTYAR